MTKLFYYTKTHLNSSKEDTYSEIKVELKSVKVDKNFDKDKFAASTPNFYTWF